MKHLTGRKKPVQFTRSRAYKKNDNAHIEEKNWSQIRQYLGYQRFEKERLVEKLNDLYSNEWNDYFNFFMPSVKLIDKYREGSKIIKKYDKPKTPFQRILESENVSNKTKKQLQQYFKNLNPFDIQKRMTTKIKAIIYEVNQ